MWLLNEMLQDSYDRGKEKGALIVLCKLIDDGILSIEQAAERAELSVSDFKEKMEKHKEDEAKAAKKAAEDADMTADRGGF